MRIAQLILATAALAAAGWAEIANIVVTSAATFERGMPWAGSIASVFCTGLRGVSGIVAAGCCPLPLELAGIRVLIDGVPAPLFAVAELGGYQQINLQVPWEAWGATSIIIEQAGQQGRAVGIMRVQSPGDFFRLPDGSGAFQHASDYSLVSRQNPARAGEVVVGYLTGLLGARTTPAVRTGQAAPANPPGVVDQTLAAGESRARFEIRVGEPPNHKYVVPSFLGLAPGLVGV